ICAPIKPIRDRVLGNKPILVNHKLMQVPVSSWAEALFLSGMLNSAPARYVVLSYTVSTQISTHVLENVPVPEFSRKDKDHEAMVAYAEEAVRLAYSGKPGLEEAESR